MQIRRAAVAGSFYPSDIQELSNTVVNLLSTVSQHEEKNHPIKAIIAPHAGYIYSGSTAADLYARVDKTISRVILLGPSHHIAFKGLALSTAKFYETPLGKIELETIPQEKLGSSLKYLDEAHTAEHSLEVHLPFLQKRLNKFTLLPIVVGDASKEEVASFLSDFWGGPETLIIVSSDLSHFLSYEEALKRDDITAKKITKLQANLQGDEACGCRGINGLIHLAQTKGYSLTQISMNNSGDTAGDKIRVVGYGAFVLEEKVIHTQTYTLAERQQIIQLARQSILHVLKQKEGFSKESLNRESKSYSPSLQAEAACFITIQIEGKLRGCIGSLYPHRSLLLDIAHNAQAAAFKDPRFPALNLSEFPKIEIHASILSQPEKLGAMRFQDLLNIIRPQIDGIILEESGRRATFLPSVWEQLPEPRDFISSLRQKAGLSVDNWQNCQIQRYRTEEFT